MSGNLIIPQGYASVLDLRTTEQAIKFIKDRFEAELAAALNLDRVSAPLFVRPSSGLNDNLNGLERPVSFDVLDIGENVEIVQSLAKWKRMALKNYGFAENSGLYTDMNAIRRDEKLDNLHSIYVDQWDWEKILPVEMRNVDTLQQIVKSIYKAIKLVEMQVCASFTEIKPSLAEEIHFVTTQELEDKYPHLSPRDRENEIAKEYGAVFVMQIGDLLKSGIKHDGRAPDYDDWSLNGDIIVWNDVLGCSFELSSMGIRVDSAALISQLNKAGCIERLEMPFHANLANGELPCTVGGGIGQSRLCMLLLKKAHVGEVQVSVWPYNMVETCKKNNIMIL